MALPPPVPPKSPSSAQLQPALSPTTSISRQQGYHQPLGTDKQQRSERRDSPLLSRSTSRTRTRTAEDQGVRIGQPPEGAKGRRRAVFCDVVLDGLGTQESDVFSPFLQHLGTQIHPSPDTTTDSDTQLRPRPATPGKPPRVDYGAVRRNLTELWMTEQSYLSKIEALNTHFALPLRQYSKSTTTAVITSFQATHLFINLEELVPLSVDFESDLRTMAHFIDKTGRESLPAGFGEMILSHVERLQPYRKWLAEHSQSDTIRRDLERTSKSFVQYIERTQLKVRDATQQTGGFTEFLAEPFQRISRYRLMLDPIIAHLPPDSPDIEPLQIAVGILSDICSMRVDEATRKAASLWGLMEAVEGFPAAMINYDRQLLTTLDVDEIIDSPDSKPTTLRCTLLLFNDLLLIAKRPSGPKTGQQLIGLDDADGLVRMYQSSHLTSSQASLLGSPKKIKKGTMGYRGSVDLLDIQALDQTPHEFLLSLGDSPPSSLASERWCGRPTRRYVVASTYAADVRRAEKEVWMNRLNEAVGRRWGEVAGAMGVWRSRRVWEGEGAERSTEVYWCVWERGTWEGLRGGKRAKLALQLERHDGATYLDAGVDGNPSIIAKAVFLEDEDQVRFSVKPSSSSSSSRPSSSFNTAETISIDRITPAIAELGLSPSLFTLPPSRPTTPSGRPRPLSGLFNSALEVFSSSTSTSHSQTGLKRGHSTTSKTSAATTSSWLSNSWSAATGHGVGASPFIGGGSVGGAGSTGRRGEQGRRLEKKSAPELVGSWGVAGAGAGKGSVGSRMGYEEQEEEKKSKHTHARSQTALGAVSTTTTTNEPRASSISSSRHRRSSSLPPPAGHFNSYTSEAEDNEGQEELSAALYAPHTAQRPYHYRPGLSASTFEDPSLGPQREREEQDNSALPYADPHAMDDAPDDLDVDLEPTIFPSSSAPLAPTSYAFSPPPRRRMMGPREPGSAPPAARRAPSPPPPTHHQRSRTGPDPSPIKPFERDTSPQPLLAMGYAPTQPLRTQSQSRATPLARTSLSQQGTPSPSPARTSTLPSPASLSDHDASASSSTATKRPLMASPRATPSKKVASLAMAWEQRDGGGSPTSSSHSRRHSPSQPLRSTNRVVSNSSAASAPRSGRRVVSNASTIRGISPPPRPSVAEEMDVFDDLSGVVESSAKEEARAVEMDEDQETPLEPMEKLRKHVQTLRAQLALDISSKENERIVSPSRLSRSPHTRNVSLKALNNPSSSFASTFSEARKSSTSVDLPALARWVDTINDLLASLDASNSAPPPSPTKGPSDVEFAVLEHERDLLAAELAALKEQLSQLVDSETTLRQDLAGSREENAKCRAAYSEICEEAGGLSDDFNKQLEAIITAFHHEITSLSTSRPTPSLEMSSALKLAVEGQAQAQQELFMLKAQMREEMREKEQWGRMLRERGLLP